MPWTLPALADITQDQIDAFDRDGFLVIESVLEGERVEQLRNTFPRLFRGDFDTGVYPDEWHWREGLSFPDVTRHMCNAWKSDLTVAKLALSPDIGRAATKLTGWDGVRLGQDTIWWKPPGTKAGALHQDTSFMDFLAPKKTVTCWFTLDDTQRNAGTIEYVPGSHRWPVTPLPKNIVTAENHRAGMDHAAGAAGIEPPEPVRLEVPAGSCVFHAGEIWHGSGPNETADKTRRSVGIHMLPAKVSFTGHPGGYIYRRYQRAGSTELDESFFPVTWSAADAATSWIPGYCLTGRR